MKILSLDQSTSNVGWSFYDGNILIDYGVKNFEKIDGDADDKIFAIKQYIIDLINKNKPEVFILENVQFQKNPKVLITLSKLLGVLINLFIENNYIYLVVEPTKWKSSCGIKLREKRKVQKEQTIKFIKNLYEIDVSEDEADAIGIGYYIINNIKFEE